MRNSLLHSPEMNEIVFENKNKAYGAFALRQDYARIMTRAIVSALLLFVSLISSPFVLHYFNNPPTNDDEVFISCKQINLDDFAKAIPKPRLVLPKQVPAQVNRQIAFVAPGVRPDEEVIESNQPPDADQLLHNQIGTETVENAINGLEPGIQENEYSSGDNEVSIIEPSVYNAYAVEQQPEFRDGMAALYKYLRDNLHYPQSAIDLGLSGTVYVAFVISKEGNIHSATVIKGVGGGLDEEALRIVRQMPSWTPGKHNGKAVAVNFTLPVKFQLLR